MCGVFSGPVEAACAADLFFAAMILVHDDSLDDEVMLLLYEVECVLEYWRTEPAETMEMVPGFRVMDARVRFVKDGFVGVVIKVGISSGNPLHGDFAYWRNLGYIASSLDMWRFE